MAPEHQVRRLLLIHEEPALADRLRGVLGALLPVQYRLAHFTHLIDAFTFLKVNPVDIVLVGPSPVGVGPAAAVGKVVTAFPEVPVVALVRDLGGDEEGAARAAGAQDCLWVREVNSDLWARTCESCVREMNLNRELASVTARLDWLVHTDSLTGLLNRKGLEQKVMDELARCRVRDENLLLLLVDLDDFTRTSAVLGHGVGDLILMAAARRINESIREQDKAGRCGTDRFLVVLPDTDPAEGNVIAEKIRLAIGRDVIQAGTNSLSSTASLGLIAAAPDSISFDEVLAKAHFVLQRGKLEGKNRVSRAATIEEVGRIRPATEGPEMVQALLRGDILEVASQPIVNLGDGRIVSRELLIRGPEGPLQRPDNLFRYCQERDIVTAVDLRCLKRCARVAARLPAGTDYHVNIMPATLLQTPAEELIRVLRNGESRHRCCLEISEQQLLGDPSVLVPCTRRLQEAGIRIAIDDVGFGNSCLEGLIMLQPQVMKVDKRLVRGLADDADLRQALQRLLKVAEVLGAEVVAEGIETADDYHALLDLGVRFGQGYLFGRPLLCRNEDGPQAARPLVDCDLPRPRGLEAES